ncbi:MAG: hypothetical protein IJM66_09975 [Muribaculaceae bacterium]|nr:hypothetical protein [Muribaculaceae bacterium]
MEHWIFISSTKRFRMNDWLAENDFVDFIQVNHLSVNDIVYLYTTAPIQRIEYKMIVEKTDIPLEDSVDDSAYSLRKKPVHFSPNTKVVRLRLIKKTDAPQLHLSMLRKYGENTSMQGNHRINGELLEYVDSFFK